MEDKKLLRLVSEIGFDMLSYGGRNLSGGRNGEAYLFCLWNGWCGCFAIPLQLSFPSPDRMKHTAGPDSSPPKGTDLDKVDRLNNLSRRLCRGKPDYDLAKEWLRQIRSGLEYPLWMLCCAHGAAALIFALFFGGSWKDGLWAFPHWHHG